MPKVTVHFTDRPAVVYTDCVAISRVTIDGHAYIVAKVTPVGVDIRLARDEPEEAEPVAKVDVEMDAAGVHFTGYLTPEQIDGPLHTGLMTDAQLTQWMGTDATRWAAEFAKRFRVAFVAAWNGADSPLRAVIEELIDPAGGGMLHGWFANAIEHARGVGYDAGARNERELASSPIVAYQGNMFGTGDRNVIFVRVMADDYKRLRELVCGDGNRTLPPHEVIRAAADRLPRIPTASS